MLCDTYLLSSKPFIHMLLQKLFVTIKLQINCAVYEGSCDRAFFEAAFLAAL